MSFTIGEIVGPHKTPPTPETSATREVECPSGKVAFRSKALARAAERKIAPDGPSRRGVYRCDWCDFYHIGHERGALL